MTGLLANICIVHIVKAADNVTIILDGRYCSSECQELDWAFHRMFCQQQTSLEEEMIDR